MAVAISFDVDSRLPVFSPAFERVGANSLTAPHSSRCSPARTAMAAPAPVIAGSGVPASRACWSRGPGEPPRFPETGGGSSRLFHYKRLVLGSTFHLTIAAPPEAFRQSRTTLLASGSRLIPEPGYGAP
jgi:hypothetical protein